MASEIRLAVTQSYYGPDGELLYDAGQMFPVGADLPEDLRVREVIAEVPDAPAPKQEKPAPSKGAK